MLANSQKIKKQNTLKVPWGTTKCFKKFNCYNTVKKTKRHKKQLNYKKQLKQN